MAQDINGIGRGASPVRTSTAATGRQDEPTQDAARPANAAAAGPDRVSLTSTSETVRAAEAIARDAPGVDAARVEAVKTALAEGRYQIDAQQLAERLIQDESLLP